MEYEVEVLEISEIRITALNSKKLGKFIIRNGSTFNSIQPLQPLCIPIDILFVDKPTGDLSQRYFHLCKNCSAVVVVNPLLCTSSVWNMYEFSRPP